MISKIPTLSLKKLNINQKYKTWIILIFVFISVALVSKIWLTLILLLVFILGQYSIQLLKIEKLSSNFFSIPIYNIFF